MIQIYDMGQMEEQDIFLRQSVARDVSGPVAEILRQVRAEGDAALRRYTRQFDGAELERLDVTEEELEAACAQVEPEFLAEMSRKYGLVLL